MDIWSPLAEGQVPHIYRPGQFFYQQGEEPLCFYYLLLGTARSIITSESGGERVLTGHRAGDLMGEASFFDGCPRVSSAVAVTRCEAVSVDQARLNRVFRAHPDLSLPMLQYLARTVRLLSVHVNGMSFLGAEQRIAQYLLTHADNGVLVGTHEVLGFSVGLSRVTVSRVLGDFARSGWVETGYRRVVLKDPDALKSLLSEI